MPVTPNPFHKQLSNANKFLVSLQLPLQFLFFEVRMDEMATLSFTDFYFLNTVIDVFDTSPLQMKAVKILPNTVGSSSPSKCAIKTSTNVNAARLAHEGRRKQKEAPFSANLRHLLRRPRLARKAHKNNFSSLTTTSTWSQLNTKRKTYKIWKQNLLFKNISKSGCEF